MSEALTQGALDAAADDLPRTLRREREARYREAMLKAQRDREDAPAAAIGTVGAEPASATFAPEPHFVVPDPVALPAVAQPAIVTAIRMPFLELMLFFLKAVLAAIPALIVLGIILWGAGWLLQTLVPSLVKMRIFIDFPR